jgi:hypothetical protein
MTQIILISLYYKDSYIANSSTKKEIQPQGLNFHLIINYYSLLNASTGSFLAAILAGIVPPRTVRPKLSKTKVMA